MAARIAIAALLALLSACAATPGPGEEILAGHDEIVIDGRRVPTGTRVVLWSDPGGFDAHLPHRRSDPAIAGPRDHPDRVARFDPVRRGGPPGGTAAVTQVMIHYDACGTSGRCFEVLHDLRGLSCHFLLDLDGTVYQTLDVRERAWHAGIANDRSVGIEIANIGAYPDPAVPRAWYAPGGGHPPGAPPPARRDILDGRVHGERLWQFDLTEPQYEALVALVAALCAALGIPPEAPRGPDGAVLDTVLPPGGVGSFEGILGHLHVNRSKVDPGPAFDWDRLLREVRRRLPAP